jgi:hypothetical protein
MMALCDTLSSVSSPLLLCCSHAYAAYLEENTRPGLPQTRINTPALTNLISAAWHADPFQRPAFSKIVSDLKLLRRSAGMNTEESPRPRMPSIHEYDEFPVEHSPSLQPADLPGPGETGGLYLHPPLVES